MAEVSLTLKGGRDYDAPWLTVKGASIEEVVGVFVDTGDKRAEGMVESAFHALMEGNQLADVKATLGATEDPPEPVPGTSTVPSPVHDTLPSENLIKAAAKKSGKSVEELKGKSKAEITAIIAGKES